jgi:hypothetical protein
MIKLKAKDLRNGNIVYIVDFEMDGNIIHAIYVDEDMQIKKTIAAHFEIDESIKGE